MHPKYILMQQDQTDAELNDQFYNPEPWAPWETKLVLYSIFIALIALVLFGFLIHKFLFKTI